MLGVGTVRHHSADGGGCALAVPLAGLLVPGRAVTHGTAHPPAPVGDGAEMWLQSCSAEILAASGAAATPLCAWKVCIFGCYPTM